MKALAKLYSRLIGKDINPNTEVLVTGGAYGSLFAAIMSHVGRGDEVILFFIVANRSSFYIIVCNC